MKTNVLNSELRRIRMERRRQWMLFRKHNILERVCGVGWSLLIIIEWGVVGYSWSRVSKNHSTWLHSSYCFVMNDLWTEGFYSWEKCCDSRWKALYYQSGKLRTALNLYLAWRNSKIEDFTPRCFFAWQAAAPPQSNPGVFPTGYLLLLVHSQHPSKHITTIRILF